MFFVGLLLACSGIFVRAAEAPNDPSDAVLKYLGDTIDWYRRVTAFAQTPVNTNEVLFRDTLAQGSLQTLKLGFTFAHADAGLLSATQRSTPATAPTGNGTSLHNMQQAVAAAAARIQQFQSELDEIDQQAATAPPASQPTVNARREKVKAELQLATLRQNVLQGYAAFSSDQSSSGAGTLWQKVDELERAVPEVSADGASGQSPSATQQNVVPESLGVLGLIGQLFTLSHHMSEVKRLTEETQTLADANKSLRDPLRAALMDAVHRSEALMKSRDSEDPKVLDAERQEVEALTARYKLLSATVVPLGEQSFVIEAAGKNLESWHDTLDRDYASYLRYIVLRLGAMATALLILMGISKVWRRITFRYVADIRRRRQFLVVRRLVVGAFVIVILIGGVVTEFGSLATYAGLLTAGIAVALQTIILSGVAHFFLIGRYGVRVGDRVTIGGITGDVIEIGLFRLYLMELGGSHVFLQPTGRVAVFSNSVLFQPSAFYKQLPGAEYAWRELALTLSPDSDYKLAETRLVQTVQEIYNEYRTTIERQHALMKDSLHFAIPVPQPEGTLRFVEAGLEFVVRYPVELRNAAEIDDRVTRALVKAIEVEPKLKLVSSGTPTIQAVEG